MTDSQPLPEPQDAASTPAVLPDQSEMTVQDLARAILARQIRPRITSVRRLAEALLAKGVKKGKKKKARKAEKKVRKLATIPGQKGR